MSRDELIGKREEYLDVYKMLDALGKLYLRDYMDLDVMNQWLLNVIKFYEKNGLPLTVDDFLFEKEEDDDTSIDAINEIMPSAKIEKLGSKATAEDVVNKEGEVLYPRNTYMTSDIVKKIISEGIDSFEYYKTPKGKYTLLSICRRRFSAGGSGILRTRGQNARSRFRCAILSKHLREA